MKYLIVWASGLADEASPELGDRTPLEAAATPALDDAARHGRLASVTTLPAPLPPSEEVALFAALGYDPEIHFSGEAALPAADLLPPMSKGQIAFLHGLATEADGLLVDPTAGRVRRHEAAALLESLTAALPDTSIQFAVGRGCRGVTLLTLVNLPDVTCLAPEETWGRPLSDCHPTGDGAGRLVQLIELSQEVFGEHEINRVRMDLGENPANILWVWGPGRPRELPSFESMYNLQASILSREPPARGLARLAGLSIVEEGADEGAPRDYEAAAHKAIEMLALRDIVIVHADEAADYALEGDVRAKTDFIASLDRRLIRPLWKHVQEAEFVRLLVLSTHTGSCAGRRRLRAPAPALMCGPGLEPVREQPFSERNIDGAEVPVKRGFELMEYFLRT
jgi:2,3-bisphosphoglycerate-independent phosphoglycerate mutase